MMALFFLLALAVEIEGCGTKSHQNLRNSKRQLCSLNLELSRMFDSELDAPLSLF